MRDWQPFREPLRTTLTRTIGIAVIAGGVVALSSGNVRRWPVVALLMLWPAVGGHWIELIFLNGLRSRLPTSPTLHRIARVAVWFAGGVVLAAGMQLTARTLLGRSQLLWLTWAVAGGGFVAIELLAHAGLHLRGRPSFYNALG